MIHSLPPTCCIRWLQSSISLAHGCVVACCCSVVSHAPQCVWIGTGKRKGELDGQNCEALLGWQVAPWLARRLVERTHSVLYSLPLSFSFRKRANRAQQVNAKKRKRTPLWSTFSNPDNRTAHLLYGCIKTLIKVLPVSDWLRMQSQNQQKPALLRPDKD